MGKAVGKKNKKKYRRSAPGLSQNTVLLLAGGGLLIWLVGRKAVAAANLTFYPGTVTSMGLIGANPQMQITIQVQNTSNASLTINSLSGNVFSGSTLIGNVYNFTPVVIPGNSMALIPVTVQLSAVSLVTNLVNSFQNGNIPSTVQVQATANVQGLQVPISLNLQTGV